MNKIIAIQSLRPNSKWSLCNDELQWLDDVQTCPTDSEIAEEILRLQAEYVNENYKRQRADEYPSLQEQLDMQYWDSVNGTTIWQDTINQIKTKYPKSN